MNNNLTTIINNAFDTLTPVNLNLALTKTYEAIRKPSTPPARRDALLQDAADLRALLTGGQAIRTHLGV